MVETDGKTKNCQISLVEYQISDLKLSNVCDTHPHSMEAHSLFSLSLSHYRMLSSTTASFMSSPIRRPELKEKFVEISEDLFRVNQRIQHVKLSCLLFPPPRESTCIPQKPRNLAFGTITSYYL